MTARLCALYKAYNSERAWKDIGNRVLVPYYRSRADHFWKIRDRMTRTDVGKFSFVNRTTAEWNQLTEGAIGTYTIRTHTFRKRVRKVKIRKLKYGDKSYVKLSEVR
jgi:hypothetical protein